MRMPKVTSYEGAHYRVKKLWGKASQYPCVGCGTQAKQWSYDGTDPDEFDVLANPGVYQRFTKVSVWPEFYRPMCISCHKTGDLARNPGQYNNGDSVRRRHVPVPKTESDWDAYALGNWPRVSHRDSDRIGS